MQDVKSLKISESEVRRLLIKNVNNRPNALATYGKGKMDATAAKDLFDKQFELITAKFNELCDLISEFDEDYASAEELTNAIKAVQDNLSKHAESLIHLQNGERETWNGYGGQIEGINAQIGEIDTALDELHAYAVALAGGSV